MSTEKKKYLFIVGCADGQWLEASAQVSSVTIATTTTIPLFCAIEEIPRQIYRNVKLSISEDDGVGSIGVFVLLGIHYEDIVGQLANHYFPKDSLAKAAILAEARETQKSA